MKLLRRVLAGTRQLRSTRERRKAERRPVPSRLIRIVYGQSLEPGLCQDVSTSGARLSLEQALKIDETVIVSFSEDFSLVGRVAWTNDLECGIAFAEMLDDPATRAVVASGNNREEQRPRFRAGLGVKVIQPDGERPAILRWTRNEYASLLLQG